MSNDEAVSKSEAQDRQRQTMLWEKAAFGSRGREHGGLTSRGTTDSSRRSIDTLQPSFDKHTSNLRDDAANALSRTKAPPKSYSFTIANDTNLDEHLPRQERDELYKGYILRLAQPPRDESWSWTRVVQRPIPSEEVVSLALEIRRGQRMGHSLTTTYFKGLTSDQRVSVARLLEGCNRSMNPGYTWILFGLQQCDLSLSPPQDKSIVVIVKCEIRNPPEYAELGTGDSGNTYPDSSDSGIADLAAVQSKKENSHGKMEKQKGSLLRPQSAAGQNHNHNGILLPTARFTPPSTEKDRGSLRPDQAYRGPAVFHNSTRKRGTGRTNPAGPAASAQSWFQRFRSAVQPKKKSAREWLRSDITAFRQGKAFEFPEIPGEIHRNRDLSRIRSGYSQRHESESSIRSGISRTRSRTGSFRSVSLEACVEGAAISPTSKPTKRRDTLEVPGSQACEKCQTTGLACNGSRPCGSCVKAGINCEVASPDARSSKRKNTALENEHTDTRSPDLRRRSADQPESGRLSNPVGFAFRQSSFNQKPYLHRGQSLYFDDDQSVDRNAISELVRSARDYEESSGLLASVGTQFETPMDRMLSVTPYNEELYIERNHRNATLGTDKDGVRNSASSEVQTAIDLRVDGRDEVKELDHATPLTTSAATTGMIATSCTDADDRNAGNNTLEWTIAYHAVRADETGTDLQSETNSDKLSLVRSTPLISTIAGPRVRFLIPFLGLRLLRPRIRKGCERLEWTCSCGQAMYGDYTKHEDILEATLVASPLSCQSVYADPISQTGATSGSGKSIGHADGSHVSRTGSAAASGLISSTSQQYGPTSAGQLPGIHQSATSPSVGPPCADPQPGHKPSFFELCVNRSRTQITLGEIQLVDGRGQRLVKTDLELFVLSKKEGVLSTFIFITRIKLTGLLARIRQRYDSARRKGIYKLLYRPMDIEFVRFGVRRGGSQTGIYEKPLAIPPAAEVKDERYHYHECPLDPLPPIDCRTFFHYFWEHASHPPTSGSQAFDTLFFNRLPKKLGSSILVQTDPGKLQLGWGVHIIEGPNKPLLAWLATAILVLSFVISVSYDIRMKNRESGFAIGQWMVAVLATALTAVYFHLADIA
ncbi:hypothetical protein LTR37_000441 [Vermiconidia calcicola]|uniref:Uncharacterized protein n=1 Tax=Vermiconidia calcicola TaxID=1690605 RepID=A0ACC3NYV3_9PEZI|nr:hypothetical protein LTR37_000441 [Vermiconidia calcicola]